MYVETAFASAFTHGAPFIQRLASASEVKVGERFELPGAVSIVTPDATLKIPMAELVDLEAERARLNKEKDAVQKQLDGAEGAAEQRGLHLQSACQRGADRPGQRRPAGGKAPAAGGEPASAVTGTDKKRGPGKAPLFQGVSVYPRGTVSQGRQKRIPTSDVTSGPICCMIEATNDYSVFLYDRKA